MSRGPGHQVAGGDPDPRRLDGPLLVLDVELRRGVFLLVLANIGRDVAFAPRVWFSERLLGLRGDLVVSDLSLWSRLTLLAPGRRVEVLLDGAETALSGEGSTLLTATVSYADVDGRRFRHVYEHDLAAYQGLPQLEGRLVQE